MGVFVIGLYDTLVGEFYPDLPRVGTVLPQIRWWGWLILLLIVILFAVVEGAYRISKRLGSEDISQIIKKLLSETDYPDKPVYILRVFYHDREKLAEGLSNEVATSHDKVVLHQLNLHDLVKLEQRKVRIYGSDNTRDEGYWILTELGKKLVKYLQKNQQVLHKEGSQN